MVRYRSKECDNNDDVGNDDENGEDGNVDGNDKDGDDDDDDGEDGDDDGDVMLKVSLLHCGKSERKGKLF